MMKRMIAVAATLVLTATAAFAAAENYTVGIGQFAEHGSLDNCRTGFVEGLAEAGLVEGDNLTILYQNAQADMGIAQQIAAQFAAKPVDLMVGIATPMAQACYNAAGEIPTIYTAVSDPVSAGFADADGKAAGEVTGTSDALPVEGQLQLIRALQPDADTVGIIYTTSEPNSVYSVGIYEDLAADYGFTIDAVGVTSQAEVPQAVDQLIADGVDTVFTPTDNVIMAAELAIAEDFAKNGIPHYTGADSFVRNGAYATCGVNYTDLGTKTADLAYSAITEGMGSMEDYYLMDGGIITVNTDTAAMIGKQAEYSCFDSMGTVVEVTTTKD